MKLTLSLVVSMILIASFVVTLPSFTVADSIPSTPQMTFRIELTQNADIWSNHPNWNWSNSGDPPYLRVYRDYRYPNPDVYARTYWQFGMESLPGNLVIDKVVGTFFYWGHYNFNASYWGWDEFSMGVYAVMGSWTQDNLTWNTAPDVDWDEDIVQHQYFPRRSPIVEYNNTDAWQPFGMYYDIDLTYLGREWYNGVIDNNGLFFSLEYMTDTQDLDMYWQSGVKEPGWCPNQPYLTVIAHSREVQVHISYYDLYTGEGISPWTFNVSARIDEQPFERIMPELTNALFGHNLSIKVLDFFGNELYNDTRTILAASYYWDIGLPIYSYKFYNQNPSFALLKIYYNMVGNPYCEFIPPYDSVNRYLKAGTYRFNITAYNATGVKGQEYSWIRTIPNETFPGAGFVILSGQTLDGLNITISEVVNTVQGTQALVEVIAQVVGPSVIWQGRDIPQIPSYLLTISEDIVINNMYMISASTNQLKYGTLMNFSSPIPSAAQDFAISMDYFRFNGPLMTTVFINDTVAGVTRYSSTNLPPSVAINGSGTYQVDTNNTVFCSREVDFRWYKVFTYNYYPGENNKYEVELNINNGLDTNWLNVTLFIPFMNASYVNNRSVEIYDMNNTVNLQEGIHWVQSKQGVFMWFNQWNSSVWRGFRLTYHSVNETNFEIPVHIEVNRVGDDTGITYVWQKDTFYFARALWTNSYRETYHNAIYIDLRFSMTVDSESIIVLKADGVPVPITGYIVAGKTIIIEDVTVPVGDSVNYIILFNTVQKNDIFELEFANIPVISTAAFIALASFLLGIFFVQFKKDRISEVWGRVFIGVAVISLFLIIIIFIYFMGVTT